MDLRETFINAAIWHGSLERAEATLAAHPELAGADVHIAAVLGDDEAVRRFLAIDSANATSKSGPHGGDALNYLCLSKYLRLDRSRTDAFLRAATALLEAGADPNTGFWTTGEFPEHETALYGAAGVAHHPEMTRLLLEWDADPNDGEAVYHSPETTANGAMQLLVDTGQLTADSLTLMLIRKHDWHDPEGAKYLLEHGADPNRRWGRSLFPMQHALARSNAIQMFRLLLDHGADPTLIASDVSIGGRTADTVEGLSAITMAAREGRADVLELFAQRGIPIELKGFDRLVAACARNDTAAVRRMVERAPHLRDELLTMGGTLIARFTINWNADGVRQLLDLGVDVAAPYGEGDGYFGIPKDSLPIHVAAWLAQPAIVRLLVERGSPVDVPDANGRTPLALTVRACVDSYWTERRSPESVRALLSAGASVAGVTYPCGYAEVDELLEAHAAGS